MCHEGRKAFKRRPVHSNDYSLKQLCIVVIIDDKNFQFKKGNRDRQGSLNSGYLLVKKEREQVKINNYAQKDGKFLSHAHYRDPYFDFMEQYNNDNVYYGLTMAIPNSHATL